MSERNNDDPRLEDVDRGVAEGTDEHVAHAVRLATMLPGWAGQRLLVDPSGRELRFVQEALAQPVNTMASAERMSAV